MERANPKKPAHRDKFLRQEIRIPLSGFKLQRTDESLFKQNYKMMSIRQLKKYADSLQTDVGQKTNQLYKSLMYTQIMRYRPSRIKIPANKDSLNLDSLKRLNFDTLYNKVQAAQKGSMVGDALTAARESKSYITSAQINFDDISRRMRKYQIEWWRKFTLSGACLIFFFIGAPLGAIIRKGGLGMPVVISVLFFVLYYIISISGEKIAREGFVDPGLGMWISGIILFAAGMFLTRKATKESTILNIDTYINFFKKLSNLSFKQTPQP
jgi:lipopolysaccharide export system permease protein